MTDAIHVALIVEGHGEVKAVPSLLYRVASHLALDTALIVHPAFRVSRDKIVKDGELERALAVVACRVVGKRGGVLILLDADDDCPADLGPKLQARAQAARSDVRVAVVLAKREFEGWFLAGAQSLRGVLDLPNDLLGPNSPEEVRDAKGWITDRMPAGRSYSETVDQSKLVARLDLEAARAADSFDKCFREVRRLLSAES